MMFTKNFEYLAAMQDVKAVYVHDWAAETIAKMHAQLNLIKDNFGEGPEYTKAAASLAYVLSRLLQNAWDRESYVTRESDPLLPLSLYVQAGPTFVFGIIWFRDRKYDDTPQAGIAGEWSIHS